METDIILDKDISLPVSHDLSEASAYTRLIHELMVQSNLPSSAWREWTARMCTSCVMPL